MIRTNCIFVDFENVRQTDWERIANKPVKVVLVLGEQQRRLPVAFVKKLLRHASQVQLVETGRAGKNALDMVLAHYVGAIRVTDPEGYFHIVSKDKGFDALIGHLTDNGALARRHASIGEIPVLMNAGERASLLGKQLKENANGRPAKRTTLEFKIQATFGKCLTESEVAETIERLIRDHTVTLLDSGEVKYAA
jgi:hypothetical protein